MSISSSVDQYTATKRGQILSCKYLWDQLASTRLAIILLLLLALASIIAITSEEFLPTSGLENPQGYYANKLSSEAMYMVQFFRLLQPYSSWWYSGLLALLSLSLTSCISHRFYPALRQAFSVELLEDPNDLSALPLTVRWQSQLTDHPEPLLQRVKKFGFRLRTSATENSFYLAGSRRGLGRLGGLMSHIGILCLLVGGILLTTLSTRQYTWLEEGDTVLAPDGTYAVTVDSFLVVDTDGVQSYSSYVHVPQTDGSRLTQTIEVNHPLILGGWRWYQSSYRVSIDKLRFTRIGVFDSMGAKVATVDLRGSAATQIPGDSELQLSMGRFVSHFKLRNHAVISASKEFENPAIEILLHQAGELSPRSIWLFANHPKFSHGQHPNLRLQLEAIEPLFATGIEVRSFPGAPFIWAGFALMTLGMSLSFMFSQERIWLIAERIEEGWAFCAGGISQHPSEAFRRTFEMTIQRYRKSLEEVEG